MKLESLAPRGVEEGGGLFCSDNHRQALSPPHWALKDYVGKVKSALNSYGLLPPQISTARGAGLDSDEQGDALRRPCEVTKSIFVIPDIGIQSSRVRPSSFAMATACLYSPCVILR